MNRKERPSSKESKTVRNKSNTAVVTGGGRNISRRQVFLISGIVVVIILGILAIPWYLNYVAPFNQTIINADGNEISARHFLERARFADADPLTTLDALTSELVIEIMAPQYGIEVTEDEIDQTLRALAGGDLSDAEFDEWYRQQLNTYQVSDEIYREAVAAGLLAGYMQVYLAGLVPYEAEQVHLHLIVVSDYDEGLAAKERLDAGEDFASVARDVSMDTATNEEGGDLGWLPPEVSIFESQIELLDVGEVSVLLPYYYSTSSSGDSDTPDFYYILMVSEKDDARTLSDNYRAVLQSMALDFWLDEEIPKHDISYNFDSEIYAWLVEQLAKE